MDERYLHVLGFGLIGALTAGLLMLAASADMGIGTPDMFDFPAFLALSAFFGGFVSWALMRPPVSFARAGAAGALAPLISAFLAINILSPLNLPMLAIGLFMVALPFSLPCLLIGLGYRWVLYRYAGPS